MAIGRIFFGESMFSRTSDASKVALVNLCTHLHAWGFELIDCQVGNPHTFSMGATEVSRREFLDALVTLVDAPLPTTGRQWQASLEASG